MALPWETAVGSRPAGLCADGDLTATDELVTFLADLAKRFPPVFLAAVKPKHESGAA